MDWHDSSCRRLDLISYDGIDSCMRCGSFSGPATALLFLPILKQSDIRLLHLSPGVFEQDIRCEISVHDLSSRPEYEAVSYTWADETGNDDLCKTILVSGQPLSVTRNCENALKRVRRLDVLRMVWIDAVCINQNDANERGHQVRLMPQIYYRAQKVLIYIGEEADNSDFCFKTTDLGNLTSSGRFHTALTRLLSRQYFSRVWVLQEVALARTATVICGNERIPWAQLCKAQLEMAPRSSTFMSTPILKMKETELYTTPGRLLDLLDISRRCKAKDPRDKVYALLGLIVDHSSQGLAADYNLSVKDLYIKVALDLASQHGWGHVLCRAGTRNRSTSALPSWVPDWSHSIENMEVPYNSIQYNDRDDSLNIRVGHVGTSRDFEFDILDNTRPGYLSTGNDDDASQYLFIQPNIDVSRSFYPELSPLYCTRLCPSNSKIIGNRLTGTIHPTMSRIQYVVVHSLDAVRWLPQTEFLEMFKLSYYLALLLACHGLGILRNAIEYELRPPQPHNKLDSLWRDTFTLDNFQQAKLREAGGDYELLVNFNDAIWKLLVRMLSRKEVQLKII
ncbi:HET-domain-containing protein [Xylaria digitata]|nr:HET-domain-containing protein [Xylaria digitata]